MYNQELYHYGVKGMKWGHRKVRSDQPSRARGRVKGGPYDPSNRASGMIRAVRGHAGPGKYVTKKRQQAGDKRDLEYLNKGGHLSVGFTKKRQAKFDARDKAAIEKRMAKNEGELSNKPEKKGLSDKQKTALKVGAAAAGTALAAYGAYKLNKFVREKHEMLAIGRKSFELNSIRSFMESRARFHQLDPDSSSVQKHINEVYRGTVNQIKNDARKDSFRTAVKDVYDNRKYLIDKARKEKWLKQF